MDGLCSDLSGGNFNVFDPARCLRNWKTIRSQPFKVKLDRLPNCTLRFLERYSGRDTAR